MAVIRGQSFLGYSGQRPSTCLGSKDGGFEPFVTAETGKKAWPTVPLEWLPSNFGHGIILRITSLKSAWKARKNDI